MQFHIPSVVHAVPATIADPELTVPVPTGAVDEATGEALEATAEEATGAWETTGAEVATAAGDVPTVTKTPPWLAGATETEVAKVEAALEADTTADAVATTAAPQLEPLGAATGSGCVEFIEGITWVGEDEIRRFFCRTQAGRNIGHKHVGKSIKS